jgi:uncharacterized peroxidase-related enzyme
MSERVDRGNRSVYIAYSGKQICFLNLQSGVIAVTTIQPVNPIQDGPATAILQGIRQSFGAVPNIFATLAHSPAALGGFLGLTTALGKGVLDAAVREQIALTVAGENGCDYCASAHTALAKGAGVSSAEAARNLNGEATDARVAAILAFARTVVRDRGRVEPAEVDRLRNAGVSDAELVEVLAHVGVNLFTNYFNHVAGTEIDFPVVSTSAARRVA